VTSLIGGDNVWHWHLRVPDPLCGAKLTGVAGQDISISDHTARTYPSASELTGARHWSADQVASTTNLSRLFLQRNWEIGDYVPAPDRRRRPWPGRDLRNRVLLF